jgi:hypothetical protein
VQDPRRKNANVYGRWFNKYADRIDMLSLARTDPEIFKLSSSVSAGLREISQVLVSAEARTRSQQSQDRGTLNVDQFGGGWGYGYRQTGQTRASVQQATRIQATANALDDAKAVMQSLRVQLGDVRRQMSVKYPNDF